MARLPVKTFYVWRNPEEEIKLNLCSNACWSRLPHVIATSIALGSPKNFFRIQLRSRQFRIVFFLAS